MTKGEKTKEEILELGLKLWPNVTTREIARRLKPAKSHAAVAYHFESHAKLMKAIIQHAVMTGNSRVIAHLIISKHSAVKNMSEELKRHHMSAVS